MISKASSPAHPCSLDKSSAACKKAQETEKAVQREFQEMKAEIIIDSFMKAFKRFAQNVTCFATFGAVCPKPDSEQQSVREIIDMMSQYPLNPKIAVPYLIKALSDSESKEATRQNALEALDKIRDKKVIPHLIKMLKNNGYIVTPSVEKKQ